MENGNLIENRKENGGMETGSGEWKMEREMEAGRMALVGHRRKDYCSLLYSGAGLYDNNGKSPIDNNGLLVSAGNWLVFDCVSNSGVGTITGPYGVSLSGYLTTPFNRPGVRRFRTQNHSPFPASNQGIYTCNIPDNKGHNISLNVGLYSPGFNGELTSTVMQ